MLRAEDCDDWNEQISQVRAVLQEASLDDIERHMEGVKQILYRNISREKQASKLKELYETAEFLDKVLYCQLEGRNQDVNKTAFRIDSFSDDRMSFIISMEPMKTGIENGLLAVFDCIKTYFINK